MSPLRRDWSWSAAQTATTKGVGLAVFLWLAARMTTDDLGAVALCAAFAAPFTSAALPNVGVVVTRRLVARLPTVTGARGLSAAVAASALVASWPVGQLAADALGDPRMPLAFLVTAAGAAALARSLPREAQHRAVGGFRTTALAAAGASVAATAATVGIAWSAGAFWATLAQPLAFHVAYAVLLGRPRRPDREGEPGEVLAVAREVLPLSSASLLWVVSTRGDDVAVALLLGAAAAGTYTYCYRLVYAGNDLLAATLNPVALRQFAQAPDRAALADRYRHLSVLVATLAGGLLTALALTAGEVLALLQPSLPPAAAPVLVTLCVLGWSTCVSSLDAPLFAAQGTAGFTVRVQALRAALALPLIVLAAPHGLVAVAVAAVTAELVTWPLRLRLVSRACGLAPAEVLRGLAAALARLAPALAVGGAASAALAGAPPLVRLPVTGSLVLGAALLAAAGPRWPARRAARTTTASPPR